MLVLNRRENEAVVLTLPDGRTVEVTVVEVRHSVGTVRLGVTAPRDMPVVREELLPDRRPAAE